MSSPRYAARRWWRRSSRYRPATMTGWIVAITLIAYVFEILLPESVFEDPLGYASIFSMPATGAPSEPWRLLTVLLVHNRATIPYGLVALTHVGFNMYMLYAFGRPLENVLGGARMLVLYVLAGLGSSVAVLYASVIGILPANELVVGASGAVFGVFGATAVVQRRLGGDVRYLYVLVAINFALAFIFPGIAWEAHIGGLLVGALVGVVFMRTRGPRRVSQAVAASVGVAVLLVVLAFLPTALNIIPPR